MWRKAMVYLGLGDDAEYDDYDTDDPTSPTPTVATAAPRPAPASSRRVPPSSARYYADEPSAIGAVRPINPRGRRPARAADSRPDRVTRGHGHVPPPTPGGPSHRP